MAEINKERVMDDIKGMTRDFTVQDGAIVANNKEEKDFIYRELRKKYNTVHIRPFNDRNGVDKYRIHFKDTKKNIKGQDVDEGMEKKVINIREELNRLDYETNCQYDLINLYEAAELDSQARKDLVKFLAQGEDADFIGNFLSQKYGAKCSDDLCEKTFAESRDEDEFILDNADDMGFWFDEIQGDEEKEQRVAGVERQYLKKTSSLDEDIDGEEPKHLGDVISRIKCFVMYDDINDAHFQSNIEEDLDELEDSPYLSLTDDELKELSKEEVSKIKNIELLVRIGKVNYSLLSQEQREIVKDELKKKYIISEEDVEKLLEKFSACDRIFYGYHPKTEEFMEANNLTLDDCLYIIKGLKVNDYVRNTKSFSPKYLGNELIIFEPKGVKTSDGRDLGDITVYVKLDVDDSTGDTVSMVSMHKALGDNNKPYKDEEITEEDTLTESGLHMDDYHISDREMLTVGWEKDKGFVVAKIWRPNTDTNTWRTEWERTYPSEEGAKRAFKRYVSKLSENLSEAKDTEKSRANRRDKISGKFNVPYTLTLKNQYNYTIIQYRIDPKNKTIEKGLFNWGDGKGSFFKNRKELQRHIDDLLAQGYKMIESKDEGLTEDAKSDIKYTCKITPMRWDEDRKAYIIPKEDWEDWD